QGTGSGAAVRSDLFEPPADLLGVVADVVQARQRGEAFQPEGALEQLGRPVTDGAAYAGLTPRFGQQATLDEAGDDRVRGNAPQPRNVGPGDRTEVGRYSQRLKSRLRKPSLDRPLDQPRTRLRLRPRSAEGVAARHVLEDDSAPPLGEPLGEQVERRLDPRLVVVRGRRQLVHAERPGRDDEQGLERPGEPLQRAGRDQAERAVLHSVLLSMSRRETLIGANGAGCSSRESPSSSGSSMNALRRCNSPRKRSRKRSIGGKRRPMWASETCGG